MKTLISVLAAITLAVLLASTAAAQAGPVPGSAGVHSIWSMDAYVLEDGGTRYTSFASSNCVIAWKESTSSAIPPTGSAFFNAFVAPISPFLLAYEFRLVGATGLSGSEIDGTWMVLRNGVVQTRNCQGKAYGLDQGIGTYFKLYCSDPTGPATGQYSFAGYISDRYDY
jgi:hypothetical protein